MIRLKACPLLMLLGLLILGACGEHGSSQGGDALGQVVARVNGEEITVSQLNAEIATVSANGQDPKLVQEEVLRAIIFRTLLRQAAIKKQLDRKPVVRLLMDGARDKVLADAYMNTVAGTGTKTPSAQDVAKYISDHPLAFGQRRIYHFQRLMLAADKFSDSMVPMFDQKPQTQSFDVLENYLSGQGIEFNLADVQLPSSDFPKQVQDQLLRFHEGDNVVVRGPQSIIVLKIKGWTEMPVQQADAQRIAAASLQQEELSERTAALRTQMIHDSKIELTGEFAGMSADEPKVSTPAVEISSPPAPNELASPLQAGAPDAVTPAGEAPVPMNELDKTSPAGSTQPAGDSPADPQEGTVQ